MLLEVKIILSSLFRVKEILSPINTFVIPSEASGPIVVVVVVLLLYVHGKHLRSCRDGQLT